MTYYVVYIFAMAGLEGNIKLVSSGVQYALFIIFSSIMFFFVDKFGRRTLLVWGAISMGICHCVVAGVLGANYEYVPGGVGGDANVVMRVEGSPAYTVIAFSYLLIIFYALTLAPICWVYAAEVWSLETRAWGMGIAATGKHILHDLFESRHINAFLGNWLFNFAIGLFIPPAFVNIKWALFLVFGILCFFAATQFFLTYPEVINPHLHDVFKQTNHSDRLAVRRSKKLRSCSARTDHTPGGRRREATTSLKIWSMSRLLRPKGMRGLVSRGLQRKRRARLRRQRLSKGQLACYKES